METYPETKPLTLETLPQAFQAFLNKFDDFVKQYIGNSKASTPPPDQWFNLDELCEYLPDKPAHSTIYGHTSAGTIPFRRGVGRKKLRFLKSEIDAWMMSDDYKKNKRKKDKIKDNMLKKSNDVEDYFKPKRKVMKKV